MIASWFDLRGRKLIERAEDTLDAMFSSVTTRYTNSGSKLF